MSPSPRTTLAVVDLERSAIVVSIAGEIDMARESELLDLLVSLDPSSGTTVELDLSEVTFVDSRGLASILRVGAYLDGRDCQLRLVRPQDQFLRVVDLVGLREHLSIAAHDEGPHHR